MSLFLPLCANINPPPGTCCINIFLQAEGGNEIPTRQHQHTQLIERQRRPNDELTCKWLHFVQDYVAAKLSFVLFPTSEVKFKRVFSTSGRIIFGQFNPLRNKHLSAPQISRRISKLSEMVITIRRYGRRGIVCRSVA